MSLKDLKRSASIKRRPTISPVRSARLNSRSMTEQRPPSAFMLGSWTGITWRLTAKFRLVLPVGHRRHQRDLGLAGVQPGVLHHDRYVGHEQRSVIRRARHRGISEIVEPDVLGAARG